MNLSTGDSHLVKCREEKKENDENTTFIYEMLKNKEKIQHFSRHQKKEKSLKSCESRETNVHCFSLIDIKYLILDWTTLNNDY